MPDRYSLVDKINDEGGVYCQETRRRLAVQRAVAYTVLALGAFCLAGWVALSSEKYADIPDLRAYGETTRGMAQENRETMIGIKSDIKHMLDEQKENTAQLSRIEQIIQHRTQ